jgi:hypothetical protein
LGALDKEKPGEVYIIASSTSPPLLDIFRSITDPFQIKRAYFYAPTWIAYCAGFAFETMPSSGKSPLVSRKNILSTVTERVFDISKAKSPLGFLP